MTNVIKSTNNINILIDDVVFVYIKNNNLRLHFSKKSGLKVYNPLTQKSKGFGSYFFKYNPGKRIETTFGIFKKYDFITGYNYTSKNYKKFRQYRENIISTNTSTLLTTFDKVYQILSNLLK